MSLVSGCVVCVCQSNNTRTHTHARTHVRTSKPLANKHRHIAPSFMIRCHELATFLLRAVCGILCQKSITGRRRKTKIHEQCRIYIYIILRTKLISMDMHISSVCTCAIRAFIAGRVHLGFYACSQRSEWGGLAICCGHQAICGANLMSGILRERV